MGVSNLFKKRKIEQLVGQVNARCESTQFLDFFKVHAYSDNRLMILGSADFTTHHSMELIFEDVLFFKGDFEWSRDDEKPLLSLTDISPDETEFKLQFVLASDGYYFSNNDHRIEIHARDFNYNTDVVLYFHKDVLAPGERIAEWVRRSE